MASKDRLYKRSFTGRHTLLPAIRPRLQFAEVAQKPAYSLLAWTFGRGSVIWRIWPAVILHTVFAAGLVTLHMKKVVNVAIPNVMLTVLGVVIGFVISYRAMSGYDRYWMGRTCWSDVIRNSRTMGRLIWFHVPPVFSPKTTEEKETGQLNRSTQELNKVMAEKRMALDLLEGYSVSLKHHLRGEVGIYYEDLYDLIRPLHDHEHTVEQKARAMSSAVPEPSRPHRIASSPSMPAENPNLTPLPSTSYAIPPKASKFFGENNVPSLNAYGTFETPRHRTRRPSLSSEHQPLAPAERNTEDENHITGNVSKELIPFAGLFASIRRWFGGKDYSALPTKDPLAPDASQRKFRAPVHPRVASGKKYPTVANHGENLPLEILRCLSEWFSVLEERGTTSQVGAMIGLINSMEESLSALERILTTPLPFVYSVHIRHTVWIYLFFLPFQLVAEFGWFAIPGVFIAAFIYLGFLAAGEEIEQPFGYDENDLDLDMFCREIIHVDVQNLKKSPCLNAYLPAQLRELMRHRSLTLTDLTAQESEADDAESSEDYGVESPAQV